MIDAGEATPDEFAETFRDISRINRFLGGTAATLRALSALTSASVPPGQPLRILDIGTGAADVPRDVAKAARAGRLGQGRRLQITATDCHPAVLELAARWTPPANYPEVTIEHADALSLPYADQAFDVALCSLTLHHLSREDTVRALCEMERVTRVGWIVNDLLRDRIACGLIWALTRLVRAHPITQHDGPVSVMRAYTLSEYTELARLAGIEGAGVEVRAVPMYRALLVRDKTKTSR